jgi:hypothetical protein
MPSVEAAGAAVVIESSVFLYPQGTGWEARVTLHGGQHWIRSAASTGELETVALEALSTHDRPPSPIWRVADERERDRILTSVPQES